MFDTGYKIHEIILCKDKLLSSSLTAFKDTIMFLKYFLDSIFCIYRENSM